MSFSFWRNALLSQVWLLAFIPVMALILAKYRASRALPSLQSDLATSAEGVTEDQMTQVVKELTTTLNPPTKVTLPTFDEQPSHIWTSNSGKRVYMN